MSIPESNDSRNHNKPKHDELDERITVSNCPPDIELPFYDSSDKGIKHFDKTPPTPTRSEHLRTEQVSDANNPFYFPPWNPTNDPKNISCGDAFKLYLRCASTLIIPSPRKSYNESRRVHCQRERSDILLCYKVKALGDPIEQRKHLEAEYPWVCDKTQGMRHRHVWSFRKRPPALFEDPKISDSDYTRLREAIVRCRKGGLINRVYHLFYSPWIFNLLNLSPKEFLDYVDGKELNRANLKYRARRNKKVNDNAEVKNQKVGSSDSPDRFVDPSPKINSAEDEELDSVLKDIMDSIGGDSGGAKGTKRGIEWELKELKIEPDAIKRGNLEARNRLKEIKKSVEMDKIRNESKNKKEQDNDKNGIKNDKNGIRNDKNGIKNDKNGINMTLKSYFDENSLLGKVWSRYDIKEREKRNREPVLTTLSRRWNEFSERHRLRKSQMAETREKEERDSLIIELKADQDE